MNEKLPSKKNKNL